MIEDLRFFRKNGIHSCVCHYYFCNSARPSRFGNYLSSKESSEFTFALSCKRQSFLHSKAYLSKLRLLFLQKILHISKICCKFAPEICKMVKCGRWMK